MTMSRRKFIKVTALTAAFTAVAGPAYALKIEPSLLRHKTYTLRSAKWPAAMPPLRAVMAADMHVGCPSVSLDRLKDIVAAINALKPDIIFLPGDFLNRKVTRPLTQGDNVPPEQIAEVLKGLKAPLGVFATLGNHDWITNGPRMWQALEQAGIRVLENDAAHVKSPRHDFWVAGLADDTTRKPDWQKTAQKITTDAPVILLSHDPATFLERQKRPVVMLCGHTHGGQVNIPILSDCFGKPHTRAPKRYYYGHVREDGCDLIVTSGIGTSRLPLRFNSPPELVRLNIQPA